MRLEQKDAVEEQEGEGSAASDLQVLADHDGRAPLGAVQTPEVEHREHQHAHVAHREGNVARHLMPLAVEQVAMLEKAGGRAGQGQGNQVCEHGPVKCVTVHRILTTY